MEGSRPATATDLPRVVELARALRDELAAQRGGASWLAHDARAEPLADTYAALLRRADTYTVVGTYTDAIVGFGVVVVDDTSQPPHGRITELFVEADAREVGVGEAMLDALVSRCRDAGCDGIDTTALPGHRAAKNFFETSGFTARLLVMHRRLDAEQGAGE